MRKKAASGVAARLNSSFRALQVAFIIGICGACPQTNKEEVIMGDVVLSEGIVAYDFGRQFPDRFVRKATLTESLGRQSLEIRSLMARLNSLRARSRLSRYLLVYFRLSTKRLERRRLVIQAQTKIFFFLATIDTGTKTRPHICKEAAEETCDQLGCVLAQDMIPRHRLQLSPAGLQKGPDPKGHFGLIASGDTVMNSGQDRDIIASRDNVIAFMMESVGVWDHLPRVLIRGVCDHAHSNESDTWHIYVAVIAAAVLKALLEAWPGSYPPARHTFIDSIPSRLGLCGPRPSFEAISRMVRGGERWLALYGIGSIGFRKSQIAVQYCYLFKNQFPGAHVFWTNASSSRRFEKDYLKTLRLLGRHKLCGIMAAQVPISQAMDSILTWLHDQDTSSWILAIDSADDEDAFFGSSARFAAETNKVSGMPYPSQPVYVRAKGVHLHQHLEILRDSSIKAGLLEKP
ncbi:uncharacterized protein NECHADRAFT_82261 [Fusarium vanettenii 77-13-4]|uniref:Nucleoside phosphorylase domain-containing protein n=1 Tax=Fusarium vanettenii (strain ATCC MYA-4622 / CBS 123669 / FGSC 9596 / NRRL 45880 / 77-13-4) TaxID=660122 RepID=C7ZNK1_FUSV7|nr:uncharacterized protein NECHADRAFT_82261 [Fusarium vanettenii 77-13-4]EEU34412.1 hypothetical protein NECHADRAFT_82261 [Fusarium vanettenii 77-13-4]